VNDAPVVEASIRSSPAYWRGRAAFALEAAQLRPKLAAAMRARAALYDRIADGLERRMVDPDALSATGER